MSDWRNIDANLRRLAKARAALDAEEARWLRAAEEAHVYRYFGCSSLVEYLEKALGYTPKVAVERIRVATALAELPVTEAGLADGTLCFSTVRELMNKRLAISPLLWPSTASCNTSRSRLVRVS